MNTARSDAESPPVSDRDAALRSAGLRATRQRLTVLQALYQRPDAVTAQELHRELVGEGEGIGLTTVYRTLTALAEADLLDVFNREGEQAFRRCTDDHHHHLLCEMCGKVEEIAADEVEAWVAEVAERRGYRVTAHRADIFGVCAECA